jgi:aerobic-type carbon monoxide dehydrogenase small subunit (CoxS/CutS family)
LFVDGAEVVTVESLDNEGTLSPVQEAFIETGAFQCGYCTPGFVLMTTKLLDEHPEPDDDTIKHYLTGNLCLSRGAGCGETCVPKAESSQFRAAIGNAELRSVL